MSTTTKTTKKKTGRKQKHWEDEDGLPVIGLTRRPDGRWRIIGTQVTYTEHDPKKAIAKFRRMTGQTKPQIVRHTESLVADTRRQRIEWLIDELLNRPLLLAKDSGIEQLGYLSMIDKPSKLPSFDEMIQTYKTHATCKDKRKVIRAFEDFVATTKVSDLRAITVPVAVAFKDAVKKRDISDKQRGHIYSGIKTLLRFIHDRGEAVRDITTCLQAMVTLKKQKTPVDLNPMPITVANWQKMLAAATDPSDEAMILLMLNCALYVEEVRLLKWEDFKDHCLISRRLKTGRRLRVAPLWQETIEAVEALERHPSSDRLFFNYAGAPLGRSGAQRRFNELAKAAGVPDVTGSHLRDGASTAAVKCNVNSDLSNIMMGHRNGLKDNYVLADPQMVKPATDAVYKTYFS